MQPMSSYVSWTRQEPVVFWGLPVAFEISLGDMEGLQIIEVGKSDTACSLVDHPHIDALRDRNKKQETIGRAEQVTVIIGRSVAGWREKSMRN